MENRSISGEKRGMSMVIQYKCPNCGDDMRFDSHSGMLSCASCGRKDNIQDLPDEFITNHFDEEEAKQYQCENCGAVVITDADTTATSCSFCGAAVVLGDRLTRALAPAKVLPFKISKDEARAAFKKWCKNGLLTPKGFMSANRIKEITGLYVPFWLYDLNAQAEVKAIGVRTRQYSRGDYIYTEKKYYDVYRDITMDYSRVPVDASEKMHDELMDKLEPFHYQDMEDFRTPYLAGYIAEKYNYDDEAMFPRVKDKISGYIDSYISSTIRGYSYVNYKQRNISTSKRHAAYVLLPVWMVYYDYDHHVHTFAMNGQTGKVVGKPPISKKKVVAWFTSIAATTFVGIKIVALMMGGGLLW